MYTYAYIQGVAFNALWTLRFGQRRLSLYSNNTHSAASFLRAAAGGASVQIDAYPQACAAVKVTALQTLPLPATGTSIALAAAPVVEGYREISCLYYERLLGHFSGGHWTCRRVSWCDRVSFQLPSSRQVSLLQEETLRLGHTCDLQVEGKFSGLH